MIDCFSSCNRSQNHGKDESFEEHWRLLQHHLILIKKESFFKYALDLSSSEAIDFYAITEYLDCDDIVNVGRQSGITIETSDDLQFPKATFELL